MYKIAYSLGLRRTFDPSIPNKMMGTMENWRYIVYQLFGGGGRDKYRANSGILRK